MPNDDITDALLSGSNYERERARRPSFFDRSLCGKIRLQTGLLAILSTILPLYVAFPPSTASYLPAIDPAEASPQILVLGVFGAVMVTFATLILVGVGVTWIRMAPVSEAMARRMVNFEEFASIVGFGIGGLSIVVTLGYFLLGMAGGSAIGGYIRVMDGANPFAASLLGISVSHLAAVAMCVAIAIWGWSHFLSQSIARATR